MRVLLTGASGFVGSNLARVLQAHGAELTRPGHEHVDLCDAPAVARCFAATQPDAIVHAAIWNDPAGLERDRARAWAAYVGATRHLVDAANAGGAHMLLVSTDWVFDGTQGPAREDEPPAPINLYGFLKAAGELVVTQRAERGTVARIAAVQGAHWARPALPRQQDAGFGYLVASAVAALRRGEPFTVWDGGGLNVLATPTLATHAGELIWRVLELEATGVLHCCGGEHAGRVDLVRRAAAAFDLDPALIRTGAPDAPVPAQVPRDTRLDASVTAARLGVALPGLDALLRDLREQLDEAGVPARSLV